MYFYIGRKTYAQTDKFSGAPLFFSFLLSAIMVISLTFLLDPPLSKTTCPRPVASLGDKLKGGKAAIDDLVDNQISEAIIRSYYSALIESARICAHREIGVSGYDDVIVENWKYFGLLIFLIIWPIQYMVITKLREWLNAETNLISERNRPNEDLSISSAFFIRSRKFEKLSYITLLVTMSFVIGGSTVFFKAASFAQDDIKALLGLDIIQQIFSSPQFHSDKGVPSLIEALPLVFVLLIRVGDVAFTSYIAYICLRIYRYQLRMAAFYLSRADAFALAPVDTYLDEKKSFLPILLDANFDFGKEKSSLAAHFAELIKAIRSRPASGTGEQTNPDI